MTDTEQNRLIAEKVLGWKEDKIGFYEEYQSRGSRQTHFTSSLDLCHKYILPQIVKDGKEMDVLTEVRDMCPTRISLAGWILFELTAQQLVTATLTAYGLEE